MLTIVIAIAAWFIVRDETPITRDEETATTTPDVVETEQDVERIDAETEAEVSSNDYRDGTYTSEQMYRVPNGQTYDVDVTLTLSNDRITDYTVRFDEGSVVGVTQYQERFAGLIGGLISGQEIDELDLSRVGGASLTTDSFNDGVDDIMVQASVNS